MKSLPLIKKVAFAVAFLSAAGVSLSSYAQTQDEEYLGDLWIQCQSDGIQSDGPSVSFEIYKENMDTSKESLNVKFSFETKSWGGMTMTPVAAPKKINEIIRDADCQQEEVKESGDEFAFTCQDKIPLNSTLKPRTIISSIVTDQYYPMYKLLNIKFTDVQGEVTDTAPFDLSLVECINVIHRVKATGS